MSVLQVSHEMQLKEFKDMSCLATFLDNHDVKRIAQELQSQPGNEIVATVISMLTYSHLTTGIPLLLYGTEALVKGGGQDHQNR